MNEILVQMFVCIFFLLCFLKIQRYLYDFMRKQRARRLSANGTHQDQVPPVPVDNEPTPPPMSGEEYSLYILGRINHANGLLGELPHPTALDPVASSTHQRAPADSG